MDKKDFLKRVEAHTREMFALGHESFALIQQMVAGHNGVFTSFDLYGEPVDHEWIYLENDLTVSDIYVDETNTVCVTVEDGYGDTWSKDLRNFSPCELMDIARHLCEL